jgi:uncharacterized protein (DUF362 family)
MKHTNQPRHSCPGHTRPAADASVQPPDRIGAVSRREFLYTVGLGALAATTPIRAAGGDAQGVPPAAAGAPTAGAVVLPTPQYAGRVVEVLDKNVMAAGGVRPDRVKGMLDRGMLELTGAKTPPEAWSLFVTPDDVVGIKVNTLSGPACSTRIELVNAVVAGLKAAGVKDSNIIIWDRFASHLRRTGYAIQQAPGGIRCYATDSPGVGSDLDVYYAANISDWIPDALKKTLDVGRGVTYPNSHFSNIFTQHITKQINLPVLKDHNIAGITLSLKNVAFGICSNTERFHPTPINCDPMIAEVAAHPMVRSKNVLNIADCLSLVYDGSPIVDPARVVSYRSLLIGTDPVAVDRIGLEILETIRRAQGLPSLWKIHTPPRYLLSAARLKLGVSDLESIEHRRLTTAGG